MNTMNEAVLVALLSAACSRWIAPSPGTECPWCSGTAAVYGCTALPLGYVETCAQHAQQALLDELGERLYVVNLPYVVEAAP